ncbi:antibiotic biosynthesis monooxygenase [Microbulbifer sp. OS29]|uniref:Antibiotic biosynthesis monooxygenase n=1 Tax=Microbulbifer okhotskensis TaxID=2926617 RepID=A0A9X2EVZ0_9GAMM|nr:putative quinol monooxygenase [Microbulbifer okhotskensis]MCO1336953.1 antibiotic biosynthesis monooxygenase [Microbulbifer okhotskensis]
MIVIRIELAAKAENQAALVGYFKEEAERNKTSQGCIAYQLYQDVSETNGFLLYEEWESMESFAVYKHSEGFRKLMATVFPLLEGKPDSVYYSGEVVGP